MKLKVYEYPDPILKKKALPVDKVDDELRLFLDNMLETMYAADGVGLAAPQVGASKRIVVIDPSPRVEGAEIMYLINPEVVWKSEEMQICEEGCLSVPGQRAEVERHLAIKVKYLDYHGHQQEILVDEYLAIVIQHELDHLDGILYIDHLSRLKRNMLLKKLERFRRGEEED